MTDDLYRLLVGVEMTDQQFEDYLNFVRKWQWVSYLLIPLTLILRISFTWLCLKAGSFVADRFIDIPFWKISIQAEIIFTVSAVAGLLYNEFFVDIHSLEQLSLNPFSLQVFSSNNMPKWSSYFFNTLNVFELSYVFFLSWMIAGESKKEFFPSLKFVASSYLPGLALWILLVSYLSVVFQP
ncbi:hypothetical protein PDL71_01205 [Lacibacter sp. MH-610]|uniref:hypothetical protein n=1 Tax=Lacibacter sp. MH-610 TaxID=3020883 RepID=UPI0038926D3C